MSAHVRFESLDFDQVRLTNFDLQVPDAQACAIQP